MNDDAPTLARTNMLLVTLISEVRALHATMAGRKAASSTPGALSPTDMRMLTPLLPAILAATGESAVNVNSLHVAASARTHAAKALRRALDATGMDHLRMGHLFRRAALSKTPIAGLFVHRLGKFSGSVAFSIDARRPERFAADCFAANMQGKITP